MQSNFSSGTHSSLMKLPIYLQRKSLKFLKKKVSIYYDKNKPIPLQKAEKKHFSSFS